MDSARSSSRSSMRKKKKDREKSLLNFWAKTPPLECDIITDLVDKGDHIKIIPCTKDAYAWWLGALKAVYPEDKCEGKGDRIKLHPEPGITLHLNKGDGSLRIKGKKHMEWFDANIETIISHGSKELAAPTKLGRVIDLQLRIEDGYSVHDLLDHLPVTGALKHGPTYIYRLWRGLLDQWAGRGGDLYVISPLIDAKRVSDLLLTLIKHRQSKGRMHLFTMPNCDGEVKWQKVMKEAKELVRELKSPNKKRLVAEERLDMAEDRLATRFGRFHCKMIATCNLETGLGEIFITSASFHKWHFDIESGDTAVYFKLPAESLVNNYLAPLGLEQQVSLVDSPEASETGTLVPEADNHRRSSNTLHDGTNPRD